VGQQSKTRQTHGRSSSQERSNQKKETTRDDSAPVLGRGVQRGLGLPHPEDVQLGDNLTFVLHLKNIAKDPAATAGVPVTSEPTTQPATSQPASAPSTAAEDEQPSSEAKTKEEEKDTTESDQTDVAEE